MSLNVDGQFLLGLNAAVDLMDQTVNLEAVHREQTHAVTENIEIVLVIRLALVEKTDLELLFALIGWTYRGILKDVFELLVVSSVSSVVIGVLDEFFLVDFFDVALLLFSTISDLLNRFQVFIMESSDEIF